MTPRKEYENIVIHFAGDSGDGMQMTGSQFTFIAALYGNDLATYPDFPAEIRAPQGTVDGVSGFQVQIGKIEIYTPGDEVDVLVAMNPAALMKNLEGLKKGGNIIIDNDAFDTRSIEKAGFSTNPLEDNSLSDYNIIEAPISSMTRTALVDMEIDNKTIIRSKNMFALGIMFWLFDRSLEETLSFIEEKFKKYPAIILANKKALSAGYFYAETIEAFPSAYKVPPAKHEKGSYRTISGNNALAWGLMAAAEKSEKQLFCGSYPITPASDILHELAKHKQLGVITVQAEDEISAICMAIGASFSGNLAATTSSGPGISLKSEALGLAVMTELPLVVVNVQRAGPSTGMPTKTAQTDLQQALYGRHGEAPLVILAPGTPVECFDFAFEASRLALEHMTPVILLSDSYLANGAEPWKYPSMVELPKINIPLAKKNGSPFHPYKRDLATLVRKVALPGTKSMEHRIGGVEKDNLTGAISYDSKNHATMVALRKEKIDRIAQYIPDQKIYGDKKGELLVVGWGSTSGALFTAIKDLKKESVDVSWVQFKHIHPLPKNTKEIFSSFKKILVCELNLGQFGDHLQSEFPEYKFQKFNKVEGQPFATSELKHEIVKHIK